MYPKILEIGQITIHTYGLLLAAAFIAGIWITSWNARKKGMNGDSIWNMGLLVIFSALVGSKIILFFSDYGYYSQHLREIFSLSTLRSTGVYYGGLLLALGSAFFYIRKRRMPLWATADVVVPGVALGQAIARVGCLSAGCCYGRFSTLPWSITFTSQYANENVGVPLNIPLHPTQIYEAVADLFIFIFLMWRLARKHTTGQILLEYLGLFAFARFVVEFYRGDDRSFMFHDMLSTSQFVAILTIIGSAIAYILLRRLRSTQQN
jgi:phosphatidylglycerol:prolipoprotein diacylglycerol transferase